MLRSACAVQEPQTEAVQKEPADDLLTQEGGDMAAERWQFCHTAAAARDAWATKLALTFTLWSKS